MYPRSSQCTLRYNTERPETLEVGSNLVAGAEPYTIVDSVKLILERRNRWKNPFGDVKAAKRVVQILTRACRRNRE